MELTTFLNTKYLEYLSLHEPVEISKDYFKRHIDKHNKAGDWFPRKILYSDFFEYTKDMSCYYRDNSGKVHLCTGGIPVERLAYTEIIGVGAPCCYSNHGIIVAESIFLILGTVGHLEEIYKEFAFGDLILFGDYS